MRIIEMRPEFTLWVDGQHKTAGSQGAWKMRDDWASGDMLARYVYHYDTLMVTWVGESQTDPGNPKWWHVAQVSIGHGGVSDQQAMNDLLSSRYYWKPGHARGERTFTHDYGFSFYRDIAGGGPRIECRQGLRVAS